MKKYKQRKGYALVLRTNDGNNQSYDGFQYPTTGYVEAPDWVETNECGNGLHGALKGVGDGRLFKWNRNAIWMVLEVKESGIVDLDGKVKFRGGNIVYCGNRQEATKLLYDVYGNGEIIGLDYHSDKKEFIIGGYGSTLTGGNGSTLGGGYRSTLTGGDYSNLRGGYDSTLTGGYGSTLTGGYGSTLTGGDDSTLTGGDYSNLRGGNRSNLAGGYGSTLIGGYGSTLMGGNGSVLSFKFWDGDRIRIKTCYVGEDGVKADTKYNLNDKFEIEEVK